MSAIFAVLFALLSIPAEPAPLEPLELPTPHCESVGEKAGRYTHQKVKETKARLRYACKEMGGSPITCAFLDAVAIRESSGRSGVRHTKGDGENGLGVAALSLRWHRDKWPGDDEDPMFCHPEVSAIVVFDVIRRAYHKFQARNFLEVQAIYGGQWTCVNGTTPKGRKKRECWATPSRRTIRAICKRMEMRGFNCMTPITAKDIGRPPAMGDRREVAAQLVQTMNERLTALE